MALVHLATSHTCRRSHTRLQLAGPQRRDNDVEDDNEDEEDDEDDRQQRVACRATGQSSGLSQKVSGSGKFGLNQRPANDRRGKSINVEKNLPRSTCRWLEMRKQGETENREKNLPLAGNALTSLSLWKPVGKIHRTTTMWCLV